MKYYFKLDQTKTFNVYLEAEYVIKYNDSPTKGLLIDTYIPLPNPYVFQQYMKKEITYICQPNKIYYRVMIARHWPKTVREDHMQILLPYIIPYQEYRFKGIRDIPPGNFTIVERGTFRIFDLFIQGFFFVYIIGFQRKIGTLNNIARGSTYALYLDRDKLFDMSTIKLKQWNVEPIYLRMQKIKTGLPIYKYFDKQQLLTNRHFAPLFGIRRVQYEE